MGGIGSFSSLAILASLPSLTLRSVERKAASTAVLYSRSILAKFRLVLGGMVPFQRSNDQASTSITMGTVLPSAIKDAPAPSRTSLASGEVIACAVQVYMDGSGV